MAQRSTSTMGLWLIAASLLIAACAIGGERGAELRVESPTVTAPSTTESSGGAEGDNTAQGDAASQAIEGPSLRGHYVAVVLNEYPHDPGAWTQGLEWHGDLLLESTGRVDHSSLRLVDPTTGDPLAVLTIGDELYAEGVTVVDGEALQLTYGAGALLRTALPVGDAEALAAQQPVVVGGAYQGEGWGVCFDGTQVVMSNGTDELTFRDPATFEVVGRVSVTLNGQPLDQLNELECVGRQIVANVWHSNSLVVIDPETGVVGASVDASLLVPPNLDDSNAVLNGIAYNAADGTYWLTGKLWPSMYQVVFEPAP